MLSSAIPSRRGAQLSNNVAVQLYTQLNLDAPFRVGRQTNSNHLWAETSYHYTPHLLLIDDMLLTAATTAATPTY